MEEKKSCCKGRLVSFVIGSAVLWIIWYFTTVQAVGTPWPIYPMIIWGLGLLCGWWKSRSKGCCSHTDRCSSEHKQKD